MSDRNDILDCLLRYATAIDSRQWALFRDVFTADAHLDYGEIGQWRGADEVMVFMEQAHAGARQTLHRLTNQVIAVDGESARARTYVDAYILVGDDGAGVNAVGIYDDELVKTDAGWRISLRTFTSVRVVAVSE